MEGGRARIREADECVQNQNEWQTLKHWLQIFFYNPYCMIKLFTADGIYNRYIIMIF